LFERQAKGTELTSLGEIALPAFSLAFDHLGEAVNTLRSSATPNQFRIVALPSVAQLWVSPRLPALRAAVPELNVSVTAMEQPPNLMREPFDLSIFCRTDTADADTLTICQDEIFPVCLPAYGLCCTILVRDSSCESSVVAEVHEQTDPADLQDQTLASL